MKRLFICLALAGCASTGPLQKIESLVPTSCIRAVPAMPPLPSVPASGIFEQVKVLLAQIRILRDHVAELDAVIDACK